MSIPNLIYKIKSKTDLDKVTLIYLFIIVGVGISSFGLGRISISNNSKKSSDSDIGIITTENLLKNKTTTNNEIFSTETTQSTEKRYVASKNGKMYYSIGCSGAGRIKKENEIWFNTSEDAEKSGYIMSSTCK